MKKEDKLTKKTSVSAQKGNKADTKLAELTQDLQRTRADFENYRRQSDLQKEQYGEVVRLATVKKLLPLIDDIERAVASQPDMLSPLLRNLEKTMSELGLTRIDSSIGAVFNPDLHDAISVDGDGENELIESTLLSGFYYEGAVLRPAMVKVVKR